jgi:hypothetical protein
LVRGFLGRMRAFNRRYRILCKFEHVQRDIKFMITVYKAKEHNVSSNEYYIRITRMSTCHTYSVGFGRIGIEDRQMEIRLKQILEILTSGKEIVGVRFGKIQKQASNQSSQKHEFILDWKTASEPGEHIIR